jgi:hypothetical protein
MVEATDSDSFLTSVLNYVERHDELLTLPTFFWRFAVDFALPVTVGVAAFAACLEFLHRHGILVVPRSLSSSSSSSSSLSTHPHVRYRHAKSLYRRGKIDQALQEWSDVARTQRYGPAYLSRAAHAIYVQGQPQEGLRILREAQQQQSQPQSQPQTSDKNNHTKLKHFSSKQVQLMKMDAQAIANGDATMVDLNARLAKQEFLGVATI